MSRRVWPGTKHCSAAKTITTSFYVDDLKAVARRAKELDAPFIVEPHANPQTGWHEFTLRDPDGYHIAIVQTH